MKKILFIIAVLLFVISVNVIATPEINTDELEKSLEGVEYHSFYGNISEIIDAILKNELTLDGASILENVIKLAFSAFEYAVKSVFGMLGIVIILSVVVKLKLISGKVENICLLGGKIIFSVMLLNVSFIYIENIEKSLNGIASFTQTLTPIIITLMASCGLKGSLNALAPSSVLFSSVIIELAVKIILPLIILCSVITAVNCALSDNKLKGIADTVKSIVTWIMGGSFMVFSAIITIQGIIAGVSDGISLRSIKYAISTSVPVIGGTVSESFSAVLLSSFYLKGALGSAGIIAILGIVIAPILNIAVMCVVLRCFAGAIRPFSDAAVIELINGTVELLKLVVAVGVGVGGLWVVYLGVITCAGGNFV